MGHIYIYIYIYILRRAPVLTYPAFALEVLNMSGFLRIKTVMLPGEQSSEPMISPNSAILSDARGASGYRMGWAADKDITRYVGNRQRRSSRRAKTDRNALDGRNTDRTSG